MFSAAHRTLNVVNSDPVLRLRSLAAVEQVCFLFGSSFDLSLLITEELEDVYTDKLLWSQSRRSSRSNNNFLLILFLLFITHSLSSSSCSVSVPPRRNMATSQDSCFLFRPFSCCLVVFGGRPAGSRDNRTMVVLVILVSSHSVFGCQRRCQSSGTGSKSHLFCHAAVIWPETVEYSQGFKTQRIPAEGQSEGSGGALCWTLVNMVNQMKPEVQMSSQGHRQKTWIHLVTCVTSSKSSSSTEPVWLHYLRLSGPGARRPREPVAALRQQGEPLTPPPHTAPAHRGAEEEQLGRYSVPGPPGVLQGFFTGSSRVLHGRSPPPAPPCQPGGVEGSQGTGEVLLPDGGQDEPGSATDVTAAFARGHLGEADGSMSAPPPHPP
ncbi:unnamed protein product [Pleuronectes platessa]|uniref:Uncharacterized protein n=1 Tax=Pleuronectes platessa TaxID=8262 RepID=A0A9N7VJ98_PLEPL|nr:unnamed protein product [Pleuronectes platessa]